MTTFNAPDLSFSHGHIECTATQGEIPSKRNPEPS